MRFKKRSCIVLLAGGLLVLWFALKLSPPIRIYEGKGYSRITFDRNSRLLDIQIAPDGRYRSPISLEMVPRACVDAALQFEDQHFYSHPGVNPFSMFRAALSAFGERRVGGSTLTMQLVRLRTGMNTKHISGKLRQIWEAAVLERHLTKREILQGYFNFAPYGGAIEGIAAASAIYFGKIPQKLTRAECAGLAVIPQSPSGRFGFHGPEFQRAFLRLVERLQIPPGERSINFPARASLDPPHFARHLTSRVLAAGGVISTSIDRRLQEEIEKALRDFVLNHASLGLRNGAVLVADGSSGEILSYAGSRDYADPGIQGFVDGIAAKRSPGSLMKPFVYAKAIDEGVIVPDSVLADIPVKLTSYEPENFEHNFLGLISAREALVKSRNIPALLLNSQLSDDGLYTLLNSAGIFLGHDADYYGAAVVLGGIEISLFDAVRLYTAFVSRGQAIPLRAGAPGGRGGPEAEETMMLFSPESAYLTREMLSTNPAPRGYSSRKIAWKTGTSSGGRDAWAVGVMGNLVTGVWIGNFDGTPNANFIGRDLAGPLLFEIFERLRHTADYALLATTDLSGAQLNLARVSICPDSGMIHTGHCPHAKKVLMIPGVSPIKNCSMHRENEDSETIYPSDVTAHLVNAGLRLGARTVTVSGAEKNPPRIVSPEEGLEYRVEYGKEPELEFSANLDGEARRVFWYVDGTLAGDTEPGRSFFWKAVPGTFTVRAIDSFGASDAKRIRVLAQEN